MPKPDLDIASAMPMVRLARTAGQGAILGAKNQLNALRAENPQAYDKSMQEENAFNAAASRAGPALRAQANEPMQELATKDYQKPEGMLLKKGGKVTASSRADGIAQRGKTRGRVV